MSGVERLESLAALVARCARLVPEVEGAASLAVDAIRSGGKVFFLGNGGSAAQAQHMATELVVRLRHDRPAIPALSLTADPSVLTAIANDMGAGELFKRQVEALVGAGDLVVAISTSGRSENVLAAAAAARGIGARVVAFTGSRTGPLHDGADIVIAVPSEETPVIQELHLPLLHLFCELIESGVAGGGERVG